MLCYCLFCTIHCCSLKCCLSHKSSTGCSGRRDKTAYMSLSDFNEKHLCSDLFFLEDVMRLLYINWWLPPLYYHILLKPFMLVSQAGGFFQAFCKIYWTNEGILRHATVVDATCAVRLSFPLAGHHLPSQRELLQYLCLTELYFCFSNIRSVALDVLLQSGKERREREFQEGMFWGSSSLEAKSMLCFVLNRARVGKMMPMQSQKMWPF